MHYFDIFVLTNISLISAIGLFRGATSLILNFLSLVASIILAIFIFPIALSIINNHTDNGLLAQLIAGSISYLIGAVAAGVTASYMKKLLTPFSKSLVNHTLGLMVGLGLSIVFNILLFLAIGTINQGNFHTMRIVNDLFAHSTKNSYPVWVKQSMMFSKLSTGTQYLHRILPQSILTMTLNATTPDNIFKSIGSFLPETSDVSEYLTDDVEVELQKLLR